ncbi:MAG: hypothetical protein EPN30_02755 [Actinomycetota bacterium]|nr:MAG: hypothetical protein EPN30_02755 [Actinomycetota bacterium]
MAISKSLPGHWILPQDSNGNSPSLAGPAVLCDLDGVLSDAAWRQHFIEKGEYKDWDSFFENCGDDPFLEEVATVLSLLEKDLMVILLTGRPSSVKRQTVSWLKNYPLRWDLLIMRNHGDYSAAKEFKSESVDEIRRRGIEPVLAFEDDRRNVDMFKAKGIPCVYIHSGYYDRINP